jgi:glutathione peroxidase
MTRRKTLGAALLGAGATVTGAVTSIVRNAMSGEPTGPIPASLWEIPLVGLDGKPFDVQGLRGKVVLFVNVASRCGLTPQYAGLEALQDANQARGFTVVGVPCNQFYGQEPGTAEEIATFCSMTYGISFPILEKQDVNGGGRSPLYRFLIASEAGGGKDISWNFEKFLVGRDGAVRARFSPKTVPEDPRIGDAISAALSA